jgi:single-strand DNA-binding protein
VEVKHGASGSAYCKFSLAVNRMKKGECDFINCTAFGKTAELIGEYIKKGDQLAVTGSLKVDKVEDKTYTGVSVFSITFVSGGSGEGEKVKKKSSVEPVKDSQDSFQF